MLLNLLHQGRFLYGLCVYFAVIILETVKTWKRKTYSQHQQFFLQTFSENKCSFRKITKLFSWDFRYKISLIAGSTKFNTVANVTLKFQCQKIFIYGIIPGILIVIQYGITVNQQALTKHLTAFVKMFESSILASTH